MDVDLDFVVIDVVVDWEGADDEDCDDDTLVPNPPPPPTSISSPTSAKS